MSKTRILVADDHALVREGIIALLKRYDDIEVLAEAADGKETIEKAVKHAEEKLCGKGRVLVRPSGTEPKVRVMLEGEDLKTITRLGKDIAKVIKEKMS